MRNYLLLFLLVTLVDPCAAQDLQLFEAFTNNAILQRDVDHPLWGWARPGEVVKVAFGEQRLSVKTDKQGRWEVLLPPTRSGGPHRISITAGREAVLLKDIYFGDVYLLSGQSNMEWRLAQSDPAGTRARAINDPFIRELKVDKAYDATPREHLPLNPTYGNEWMVGDIDRIGDFSAVGSYFASYLLQSVNVPIGLIHASWGGSRIEPWMRPEALGMDPKQYKTDNADVLQKAGAKGRARFAIDFPGRELPTEDKGTEMGWLTDDFDDSDWPTMALPTHWEAAGYPSVDGHFYFRRTFTLTAAQAAADAILHLGAIDDGDYTHVNGELVGSYPSAYSTERVYTVPARLLRAGENTLTIRVYDAQGGGGFSAAPEAFKLETVGGKVPLAGDFRFNIGEFRVGGNYNQLPVVLYNAMIAPLQRMPLTGVLWYQGESNAGEGDNVRYAGLMKGLVRDWRDFFGQPDLPFYWVQLANYTAPPKSANEPGWAVLRQSQTAALELPNTGQAVITDIGEADDIHPKNKWEVGRRLSLHALKNIYGKDVVAASPVARLATAEGPFLQIAFDSEGEGLMVRNRPANGDRYDNLIEGITVMDTNGQWHHAFGMLSPDTRSIGVILPAAVKAATRVRYAWASNPDRANLFSTEGLPVTPFDLAVERD